jgi:hypothetical protein
VPPRRTTLRHLASRPGEDARVLPRTRALVLVLLVPGCFNPHYPHVRCGHDDACPSGLMCNMTTGFCEPPDGGAPDGGSDTGFTTGSDSGSSGTVSCLQYWLDGGPGLALSQPKELTALASAGDNRHPWISADGLRLYFGRNPGILGGSDIYLATRTSTAADFNTPSEVINLDTGDDENGAALSGDEKLVVFFGNHNTTGGLFRVFVSKRGDPTQPFPSPSSPDQTLVASVNIAGDNYDPFLSSDGLRLYFAPAPAGESQQIRVATRTALDKSFGSSVPLAVINSGNEDANPTLSLDERIIVFSSRRPAGTGLGATHLWYSTRPSATADFAQPKLIPSVNSDQNDGDPMLSADGCELYFASRRIGGKYHLFRTQVVN